MIQTVCELAKKNYGRTWTIEMLQKLVEKGKLEVDDYVEITQSSPEDLINSLENIQARKLNELSTMCEQTIYDGIDIETTQGIEHFSLTLEDQINIQAQAEAVKNGATQVPYHADGEGCRIFTPEEINSVLNSAYGYKTYHTTYFNQLKILVMRCTTVEEVVNIVYGMSLPEDLDANLVELTGKSSVLI